jgi:hypothetical protein
MYSGCGNWKSDTLTEDLDLLSRSVKNWEFKYLKMWTPAELPAIISATRSQQFRWNKGGETSVKCRSRTQSKSID